MAIYNNSRSSSITDKVMIGMFVVIISALLLDTLQEASYRDYFKESETRQITIINNMSEIMSILTDRIEAQNQSSNTSNTNSESG